MTSEPTSTPEPTPEEDEISLLDQLIVLARHKKLILGLPVAAAVIAAGISLVMPNIYTATTKILPPQQGQSNAVAILGQIGVLGGGGASALGIKNPNDVYVAMLKSRTVADELIKRFDLKKNYDESLFADTRKALEKNTNIVSGKDGVITIEVDDRDPKRAAAMSNGYIEALENLTRNLAVTEASQRRLFFEKQLQNTKQSLISAEIDLMKFKEQTGLVQPEGQAAVTISASAALHAQVTAKEVQLAAMRSFATGQNPDLMRNEQELAGLKAQLEKLEKNDAVTRGDVVVPLGKAPEATLDYVRKVRDLKYQETLFELLAKQFELAKIDEAKNATLIQVLDKAVEPEKKSRPKRSLIVIMAALVGGFLAVILAFMREAGARARANPEQAARISELNRLIGFRTR